MRRGPTTLLGICLGAASILGAGALWVFGATPLRSPNRDPIVTPRDLRDSPAVEPPVRITRTRKTTPKPTAQPEKPSEVAPEPANVVAQPAPSSAPAPSPAAPAGATWPAPVPATAPAPRFEDDFIDMGYGDLSPEETAAKEEARKKRWEERKAIEREKSVEYLAQELRLTDYQKADLLALLEERDRQRVELVEKAIKESISEWQFEQQVAKIRADSEAALQQIFTPDQYAQHQTLNPRLQVLVENKKLAD